VIDAKPVPGDALVGALRAGADLGLLGIEFSTRRRNRLSGRVADDGTGALVCRVDQSFGNCPQYIHERGWRRVEPEPGTPKRTTRLTQGQRAWVASADTFFLASGYRGEGESPTFGMDASHRGGNPGFVCIRSATQLVFPDYAGNNHFNTICSDCPVVLMSAGVGVTPMVSMLHALAEEEGERPVLFVHGARDGRHHPFAQEVRAIAGKREGIRVHVAYSRPRPEDEGCDGVGRIDGALLARLVAGSEAHYFLCGPPRFMADLGAELERRGVPATRIHTESFGPTGGR